MGQRRWATELGEAPREVSKRRVASWAEQVSSAELFISVITIQELEHGVMLMERSDTAQGSTPACMARPERGRCVQEPGALGGQRVARRAAALHVPDAAPFRDALIGATALTHDMTVVTRDRKDFDRFDQLDVIDPWS